MQFAESQIVKEDIQTIVDSLKAFSNKLEGKTFLITGGAGFLGKYLVQSLRELNSSVLSNPCKIIVLDNYISGIKGALEQDENTKIIEHNIINQINIPEEIDYIFHAASIAAPVFYNKYKLETIDVGFTGTRNMLELARQKDVKSFMFFSTSEVYGNPDPKFIPTPETYLGNVSCIGPRASYDEPKRIAETLCMTYGDLYNIPIKIVRPFNVFGPGMRLDDGRGAINFVISALKGQKIPVYGTGKNTRTWCYITDATTGFFQILFSDHNNEVFNIGNDEREIEMRHLAEIVAGLVKDRNAQIHQIEGPNEAYTKADVSRRCPDLTKIRTMIGYVPKVNLVAGLRRFIEWAEEELNENISTEGYIRKCRICENENLKPVLSLGNNPLANSLLSSSNSEDKEEKYPLELQYCDNCHLCQLSYVVDPKKMFSDYVYLTSTTQTFRDHFKDYARNIYETLGLPKYSLVVDIGSNDGILLKFLSDFGARVIGVEPAENICKIARDSGIDTIQSFFTDKTVEEIKKLKGQAQVVTANNVFAHVNDIKSLTNNVRNLLTENGVFIIEVQYLQDTIKDLTFDNIYHEHLSYFSVSSLKEFFSRHSMDIFRVEHVHTHGGSIRVFVKKSSSSRQIDESVQNFANKEKEFGLHNFETYKKFAEKIQEVRDRIREFTVKAKSEGKRIVGYGAPAKATTLLNFYKLGNEYIDYIIEDNPLKQGKVVPGVKVRITDKKEIENAIPDYIMIFAWNFADEIMKNNEHLHQRGAKFVVPTAELRVI